MQTSRGACTAGYYKPTGNNVYSRRNKQEGVQEEYKSGVQKRTRKERRWR